MPPSLVAVDAREKPPWGLWLLVGLLAVTSLALVVITSNPLLGLVPTLGCGLVYGVCKLPLRIPMLVLFAGVFVLEIPGDMFAGGSWKSPFAIIGALLFGQLKTTLGIGALVITGFDLCMVGLFLLYAYRRATGNTIDRQGAVPVPMPLVWASWGVLAGCMFSWAWGMAHGGSFRFSLWQVQRIIYVPLVFLLMLVSFPNQQIHKAMAKIMIAAACIRAALAIYLRTLFPDYEYVTTHPDSMMFATVTCFLVIRFLEERSRRSFWWMMGLMPLIAWGMVANDRRLVWVEIGFALLLAFILARRTRLKVNIVRGVLYVVPVVLAYVAAGWNSGSGIFSPVRTIKSVLDSKSDGSTLWRDYENFNLVTTMLHNPIIGTGLGHPFEMPIPLPDVTSSYELEPYAPHNSILGLWAFNGYVGFSLHWMPMVVLVYLGARICFATSNPEHRTVALTGLSVAIIYMLHLYGDLALGTWTSVFLIPATLVVVGKLAVELGVWPTPGFPRPPLTSKDEPLRRQL